MLVLLGCSHRSAPVAFREQLAFREEEVAGALERLCVRDGIEEGLILSTCNRVEIVVRIDSGPQAALDSIKAFLVGERGVNHDQLREHSYHYLGREAVEHVFQVASGLDSMILGEPQILGQVKRAYFLAKGCGTTGPVLERLMQQCLATAKRVRTDTGISRHAVSVAYAAVNLARQIFGKLDGRVALLIGAGKMAELVARHLVSRGIEKVFVTSRTYNHAVTSAENFGGEAVYWNDGLGRIGEVDIVVSCTGAPKTILGRKEIADARRQRRGQPLFIIDIAVPRDVDPDVNTLDNVYLYDIDGLQEVVDANLQERREAAEQAQRAIDREVDGFDRWRQSLEITPTIVSLREKLLDVGRNEMDRFRGRLGPLTTHQNEIVENLTRSLIQKILHGPVRHLKGSVDRGDVDATTSLYRQIFGLDDAASSARRGDAAGTETPRKDGPPSGPQRVLKGGKDG